MPEEHFDAKRLEAAIERAAMASAEHIVHGAEGEGGGRGGSRRRRRRRRSHHGLAGRLEVVAFASERLGHPKEYVKWARSAGRRLASASARSLHARGDYQTVWPWLRAFALIGEELPAADRALWRDALAAECGWLVRQMKARRKRSGSTSTEIGTGPNHYIRWVAVSRLGADVLGRSAWGRLADSEAARYARDCHPDGYWPEHHGPAVRYNGVSVRGMAMYRRASGSREHDAVIRRAVEFNLKASYPGGAAVETFDERNRYGARWGGMPLDALSLSAMGRRALVKMLERRAEPGGDHRRGGGWLGSASGCIGQLSSGRSAPLPWERKDFRFRLSGLPAVLRHSGQWTVALSAIPSTPVPHNPYMLDRTQLVSIHHREAGLVIGGGNDKRNPRASTFSLFEGGEIWYNVPVSGKVRRRDGKGEELEADYGPFSGRVLATPRSRKRLDLLLEMKPRTIDDECLVNLQVPVGLGGTVRFAGKAVKLTRRAVTRQAGPRGATLAFGRARIKLPAGAVFTFPYKSHTPYGGEPHVAPEHAWLGLVTMELGPEGGSARLTIEVC